MLPFLPLTFTWRIDDGRPLWLDPHAAGALRGALGRAMRHQHCATLAATCDGCRVMDGCVWAGQFLARDAARDGRDEDGSAESSESAAPAANDLPLPLCLTVDTAPGGARVAPGETFRAHVVLLGRAAEARDAWIRAGHLAGRLGFSRDLVGAHLEGVDAVDALGRRVEQYVPGPGLLPATVVPHVWRPVALGTDRRRVRIETVTRLRLTERGEPLRPESHDPDWPLRVARRFTEQLVARVDRLGASWGPSDWQPLDALPWLAAADALEVVDAQLRFDDPPARGTGVRAAPRRTGGLVGSLTLDGVSPELLALWQAAELFGVGRMTALGLGRVRVRVVG